MLTQTKQITKAIESLRKSLRLLKELSLDNQLIVWQTIQMEEDIDNTLQKLDKFILELDRV